MEQKKDNSEEVDLGVLFLIIKKIIKLLISPVKCLFNWIQTVLETIVKFFIKYFYITFPLIIISTAVGKYLDNNAPREFISSMTVRTNHGTKYQMIQNINKINSLISDGNNDKLVDVLKISESEVNNLNSIVVEPALLSRNDLLLEYRDFIKKFDTLNVEVFSFDQYVSNRDLTFGDIFEISVISNSSNVFEKLNKSISYVFESNYATIEKKKHDSIAKVELTALENHLQRLIDYKSKYLNILEAVGNKPSLQFGKVEYKIDDEDKKDVYYDFMKDELDIRSRITTVKVRLLSKENYFEILSNFKSPGDLHIPYRLHLIYLLPLITFLILLIIPFVISLINKFKY